MKVALASHGLFPDRKGGMERHSFHLARELQRVGFDVHVAVPEPQTQTSYPFPVTYLPWPSHPLWLWSNWKYSKNVGKWLEDEQFHVAIAQGFNLWGYLKQRKIPLIFHPHGLEMFGSHQKFFEKAQAIPFQKLVCFHAKHSDLTISLGGKLTTILKERVKVPDKKIQEIPNAVDCDQFKDLGLQRKSNSFLFVGRLAFNKGLDLLSEALKKIPNIELELKIIGDGPMRSIVEELVQKDSRIQYISNIKDQDLQKAYQEAECLLFTSRFEGMPTVLLEAMSSGCTAIATDIGAVDQVVDSECGMLIQPHPSEIAGAITSFTQMSKKEKSDMAKKARTKVRQKFSWNQVIHDYERVLKHCVRTK